MLQLKEKVYVLLTVEYPDSSYGRQPELLLLYPELSVRKPELRVSLPVQGGGPFPTPCGEAFRRLGVSSA